MALDTQRIPNGTREISPCKDCTERFHACSDKCPKDKRGEYGYMAWKAEIKKVNDNRKAYDRMKWRRKF
jgi:hypothetical protein